MDRGMGRATGHGVAKSRTRLKGASTQQAQCFADAFESTVTFQGIGSVLCLILESVETHSLDDVSTCRVCKELPPVTG